MMVNTLTIQKKFLNEYGPVPDFDHLFYAIRDRLADKIAAHTIDGQITGNRLIGLQWKMQHTTVNYSNGNSIATDQVRYKSAGTDYIHDTEGYSGKIWIRTAFNLRRIGSMSNMFHGSMYSVGTGGYSTHEGPWNALGKELFALEVGVPYADRQDLGTYAYSGHFFMSDFPDLGELAVMSKLGDKSLEKELFHYWQEPGVDESDQEYIEKLTKINDKSS